MAEPSGGAPPEHGSDPAGGGASRRAGDGGASRRAGDGRRRVRRADLPRDPLGRLRGAGQPDALGYLKALRRDPPAPEEAWRRAVALQAEQRCYEAYEHVVTAWRHPDAAEGDRPLWRALAQVAAACCHVQRGNTGGARKILDRAAAGLAPYAPGHDRVDVQATLAGVASLRAGLAAGHSPDELPPLVARDGA